LPQVFIVGFGKFGKKALAQVIHLQGKARVWIIDSSPEALSQAERFPGIRVLADGPKFLTQYQEWIGNEDWIIPALPLHLAWKWLDLNLKTQPVHKAVSPPNSLGLGLPYSQFVGKGLFLSYATFLCPENCPAPIHKCFKTKESRAVPLWKFIANQGCSNGTLEVIESQQIAPGVGGYRFRELKKLKSLVLKKPPPFFVATACRCHGVIHGLTW
jgi:hypothetical protein